MVPDRRVRCDVVLLFLTTAALGACADAPPETRDHPMVVAGQPGDCETREPVTGEETLVLPNDPSLPCVVLAVYTGVTLAPSVGGSHPDPSPRSVAWDSRGRVFTSVESRTGAGFLVWDPVDGAFIESVGRRGEGPGEFPGGGALIWVGAEDTIFAVDGRRLLVFDSDFRFSRSVESDHFLGVTRGLHILPDGRILLVSRGTTGGAASPLLRLLDREGVEIGTYHDPAAAGSTAAIPTRASALSGLETVWIGPEEGLPAGHVLEERRLDGTLVRSLSREVQGELAQPDPAVPNRQVPRVINIKVDNSSRLWVVTESSKPGGRRFENNQAPIMGDWTGIYEQSYEVLDPIKGTILAAGTLDESNPVDDQLVHNLLPLSSRSYHRVSGAMGLTAIRLYELFVVARDEVY